jgi:xanthine dehydrogenase molybdenum-binding subunit
MEDYTVVGKRLPLIDAVEKATGEASFTSDLELPRMLYAKFLRSPLPHAKILGIDTSKAEKLPGVKAVLTKKNTPRIKVPITFGGPRDRYVFDEKVRYFGEEVAAVAATSQEVAEDALRLIKVDYQELPAIFDPTEAMKQGAPLIHDEKPGNIAFPLVVENGNVEVGFREADKIFEETFRTQSQRHCCMETHCCVASFDMAGQLTLWVSHQAPLALQELLSEYFSIPLSKVRVILSYIGGGFGSKLDMLIEHTCALLSQITGRPVKIVLNRDEEFASTLSRHADEIRIKVGVKKDGALTAMESSVISNVGAYMYKLGVLAVTSTGLTMSYRCPNVRFEGYDVYTNLSCAGAMRGYGHPQAFFALESMMDMIAHGLGIDPVEFRLKNFRGVGDIAISGKPITTCGLPECLEKGVEEIHWAKRTKGGRTSKTRKRGIGVACFTHMTGPRPGKLRDYSTAFVKLSTDGSAHLITGAADLGTGCKTTLAQIVAEELGLTIDAVAVTAGDTASAPFDSGTFASRTLYMCGLAAKAAAADAKQQLLIRAAENLGVESEDIEVRGGKVYTKLNPNKGLLLKDITKEANENLEGRAMSFLGKASRGNPGFGQSFGAEFAEVEVSLETGIVEVIKIVVALDVGKAINPMIVEGQIEGAVQQGVGFALTENPVFDGRTGKMLNPTFSSYLVPTSADMPEVKVFLVETIEPSGPFGAKGMSEPCYLGIAPAIANAIYNAVGIRLKDLPMSPEKVLKAL